MKKIKTSVIDFLNSHFNRGFNYKQIFEFIQNEVHFRGRTPVVTVSSTLTYLYQSGLCDRIKNSDGNFIYFKR